ncbi:hypothetical protein [Micavibrio aeruginosavorus]|uniref:Uncharacterized protein n=1 Tax=Micavibrio aeruginosavorus EPB TaxID=349215 RepID=M4VGM3_9BACT|nr:hypothetical protein [Micavibrio aeruginosavorus]AGH98497.1 hypothetical protein A11S_1694 [Micavibrio aeruginosavorus EPB]
MTITNNKIKILSVFTFALITFSVENYAYAGIYKIGIHQPDNHNFIVTFECPDDGTICQSSALLKDKPINIETTFSKHEAEFVFRMADTLLFSQQNKPSYTTIIYPDSATPKTETIYLYIPHPAAEETPAEKSVFRKPQRHVATLNIFIEKE